ncbi:MAG: fibronectin type III domain-containing protein [Methylococcaceae bacterium]|nr:fibronectin type III domain-containing protein [Methylococcaceae bacterium]
MQAKLIITFTPLSGADFLTKAGTIVNAMRDNADFPEPWPPQVPSFPQLEEAYNAFGDAFHASASRDRVKISEKVANRATLVEHLKALAGYLEVVAKGDTTKLLRTGYDLRKDIVHGTGTIPLSAPSGFIAKHGKLSGSIVLHATNIPGAVSYEAHYTDGDPANEESWKDAGTFPGCNRIDIGGLVLGKLYWFRIRAIGNNGAGAWTDPASVIII